MVRSTPSSPVPTPTVEPAPVSATTVVSDDAGDQGTSHHFCPNCGTKSIDGASYCASCGRPLGEARQSANETLTGAPTSTVATPPPPPLVLGGTNPTQRTDPMAIVGFIMAFLFWPVGIVLGHVARRNISRSGERGAGLALAGLIISYVSGAIIVGIILLAVVTSSGTNFNNLDTLQHSVAQRVDANLSNPDNSAYSPGTSVKSVICANNSGSLYTCSVSLSNGESGSLSVTVASDGSRWVSNG